MSSHRHVASLVPILTFQWHVIAIESARNQYIQQIYQTAFPPKKMTRKHKRNPNPTKNQQKYDPNKTHDTSNETVKYQAIFSNLLDLSKPSSQLSMSGLSFHVGRGTKSSIFCGSSGVNYMNISCISYMWWNQAWNISLYIIYSWLSLFLKSLLLLRNPFGSIWHVSATILASLPGKKYLRYPVTLVTHSLSMDHPQFMGVFPSGKGGFPTSCFSLL